MFDIGFWELTVIAVIGLIVLGPERLPVVARTLGAWVGRAKGYVRGLTSELEREVNVDDLRHSVRRTREQIESDTRRTVDSVRDPLREVQDTADSRSVARDESATSASSTASNASANPVADAASASRADADGSKDDERA